MTRTAKNSGLFSKLTASLAGQRYILADLLRRLTCLGSPASMKSSVFRKFLFTLEQISFEKEKEVEIISRIQAIEEHHRRQRKSKKLKCATDHKSKIKAPKTKIAEYEPECDRSGFNWLAIIAYFYMRPNPKD